MNRTGKGVELLVLACPEALARVSMRIYGELRPKAIRQHGQIIEGVVDDLTAAQYGRGIVSEEGLDRGVDAVPDHGAGPTRQGRLAGGIAETGKSTDLAPDLGPQKPLRHGLQMQDKRKVEEEVEACPELQSPGGQVVSGSHPVEVDQEDEVDGGGGGRDKPDGGCICAPARQL